VFTDPQNVTYASTGVTLPATGRSDTRSEYKTRGSDGAVYSLTLTHEFKARNRVVASLRRDSYMADPLRPTQNVLVSASATFTMNFPNVVVLADVQALGKALHDWLSDATILKMLNGET